MGSSRRIYAAFFSFMAGFTPPMPMLGLAIELSGCNQFHVIHKPCQLSDNGSSFVSRELAEWLRDEGFLQQRLKDQT